VFFNKNIFVTRGFKVLLQSILRLFDKAKFFFFDQKDKTLEIDSPTL